MIRRFLAFLTAVIVVFSASLLAAAGDATSGSADGIPDWAKTTAILGGIASGPLFSVWYAYYMTTNRIPAIEKDHREQIEELQHQHVNYITESHRVHADHIALLTNNFRADLAAMWNTKHDDDKALAEAIRGLGDKFTCRYSGSPE